MRKFLGALIALAVSLTVVPGARASLVEALDLAALVERSDDVVLARVMGSESRFDEIGRIVTDVTMQVEQAEKGQRAPGALIVVRHLGGTVGDLGMRIEGEPTFEAGETVLVFGRRMQTLEAVRLVGMSQGAMRIDEKEGARWVRSAASGAALVTDGNLRRGRAAVPAPRKLDDVLSEIRTLVAAKK